MKIIEEYEELLSNAINDAWYEGDTESAETLAAELEKTRKLHDFMEMDCS